MQSSPDCWVSYIGRHLGCSHFLVSYFLCCDSEWSLLTWSLPLPQSSWHLPMTLNFLLACSANIRTSSSQDTQLHPSSWDLLPAYLPASPQIPLTTHSPGSRSIRLPASGYSPLVIIHLDSVLHVLPLQDGNFKIKSSKLLPAFSSAFESVFEHK